MYTLADYVWMIGDERRVRAYASALRDLVRPGDRVVEIGAGFGFFSVLAARAGASHVDAIETNPVVHLGRRIAAANGVADRITFHAADSTRVKLDRRADVLLADIRGPLPLAGRSLEVLMDARRRLLKPGGIVISARDTLFAAPARTPAVFAREVQAPLDRRDLDLEAIRRILFDSPMRCAIGPEDLLQQGAAWSTIEYSTLARTDHGGHAEWMFDADAAVDGLALWFETDFGNGSRFDTAPGGGVLTYNQVFLPFRRSLCVPAGGTIHAALEARLVHENYVWSWRAAVRAAAGGSELDSIAQNSLPEILLDPHAVPLTSLEVEPSLGPRARALLALLDGATQGQRGVDLARRLHATDRMEFPTVERAQAFVAAWLAQLDKLERGAE
jgi:protein arginine N-methyltransferase 1